MTSENQINQSEEGVAKFWAKWATTTLGLIDSLLGKLGSVFPWLRSWLDRPIILPHAQRNWWHMGQTGEQKPSMQIVTYWYVTNRTDRPINILNAYIKRPRWQGMVMTKDVRSDYHGSYPVPPNMTTDLDASFYVSPPFRKRGKKLKLDIVFIDQNGQKRIVRGVEVPSHDKKRRELVILEEEAVYQLAHDIEKRVAGVLKDEITRYKKYGRRSGRLGSLHAEHHGRTVSSIYQDSWTDSRSGERQEIVTDPESAKIKTENGDALVKFYSTLGDADEQELFVNSLLTRLNKGKEYYCISYLIFYVLIRIGAFSQALDGAGVGLRPNPTFLDRLFRHDPNDRLLEPHQRHGFGDAQGLINGFLRYEHTAFTDNDIDLIEEFLKRDDEFRDRIIEKVNSVRSFRLTND